MSEAEAYDGRLGFWGGDVYAGGVDACVLVVVVGLADERAEVVVVRKPEEVVCP